MIEDRVKKWDDAAGTPARQRAIHPTGGDPIAYLASGEAQAQRLAELLGAEPGRIIDFGAGDGRVTIPLANRYDDVIAVDASARMLEELERSAPDIPRHLSAGPGLAELELHPNVIVALAVLIHHTHAGGRQIIAGLAAALEPGGRLYLDLPLYELEREGKAWNDVTTWNPAQLDELALELELDIIAAPCSPGAFAYTDLGLHHGELVILAK